MRTDLKTLSYDKGAGHKEKEISPFSSLERQDEILIFCSNAIKIVLFQKRTQNSEVRKTARILLS